MSRVRRREHEQRRAEEALETALEKCESPEARYYVRQALQLVRVD